MAENWTLQVVSHAVIDSWGSAARRLRALLDALSVAVERAAGEPPVWRDEILDADSWKKTENIAELMLNLRVKNHDGTVADSVGALGVVQGYLDRENARGSFRPGASDLNVRWSFRGVDVTADCQVEFSVRDGRAGGLDSCSPEWLASLMCGVAQAIDADRGRVVTRPLLRALHRARANPSFSLGAVCYAAGVRVDELPPGFRGYSLFDCSASAGGKIVVVAPDRVLDSPVEVAEELVSLEPIIAAIR